MFKAGDKVLVITPKGQESVFSINAGAELVRTTHDDVKGGKLPQANSSLDAVASFASTAAPHSDVFLADVARVLKPSGTFVLREVVVKDDSSKAEGRRQAKELFSGLTLAGFVNSTLKMVDEHIVEVTTSKPKWEIGASAAISLKRPATTVAAEKKVWTIDSTAADNDLEPAKAKTVAAGSAWKISGDEDELIDESTLLKEEDLASLANRSGGKNDDCGTGGAGSSKRACKNCVCGRADGAMKESPSAAPKPAAPAVAEAPKSSCGSCGLGDAFRCSGCPYRGLPPFKPGEKVLLQL